MTVELPPSIWIPQRPALIRAMPDQPSGLATFPFPVFIPKAASGSIVTAFGPATFNQNDSGVGGFSYRVVTTALANGGTQFRVTFEASSVSSLVVAHASIGKSNSGGLDTTATPVELLFSGVAGFSISSGQQITSDWATISLSAGDKAVVVIDFTSGGERQQSSATGVTTYYKAASASYNATTLSGMSTANNLNSGIYKIEAQ